ncbi:MAG: COR domain-containing protein [Rubrivivax sp.]
MIRASRPVVRSAMARRPADDSRSAADPMRVEEILRRSENKARISLAGLGLTQVPKALRHARQLRSLDLSHNRIARLPDWLDQLPELRYIRAADNPLVEVADGLAQVGLEFRQLLPLRQQPDLPFDRLTLDWDGDADGLDGRDWTALLGMLDRVRHLRLLETAPQGQDAGVAPGWGMQRILDNLHLCARLRSLLTQNVALGDLPVGLVRLSALEALRVERASLRNLPRWLPQLPLVSLSLPQNLISSLPDWLPEMRRLEVLDLGGNQRLKRLPPNLFELPALQALDLDGCPVREIPASVLRAPSLTRLQCDSLRMESPPSEVARQGLEAIRDYWRQREESGIDYLCEAKLIVLGESGAGKSTLVRKIVDPSFVVDPHELSTEGIDVVHHEFTTTIHPRPTEGSGPALPMQRQFQVNIWDFGGQEIYHATHQFFLTRRSVYLLVCDDRKEDTDFAYWLQAVEALGGGSPLLIIQNEKQDRSRDIGLGALRERFVHLRGAWATNLASNRGLSEILAVVRHELQALPHVGQPLPATWKRVREALEQDTRDWISQEQFMALCSAHGFSRREDALQLSQYLHDLGICLHFQDDPMLKHTVVLKPTWGTDAVYRVLDDPQVKAARGRFGRADLNRLWCETKYQGMQDELLHLMAKFQLCYALDDRQQTWMAPQLLSSDRPGYRWPEGPSLTVSWRYGFLPKGLLTRFIVTQHHLIAPEQLAWRHGVVLMREGSRAEVIEDYPRRRIDVRVHGADARGLLAIVDDQLQRLNDAFPRLEYERWLPCPCVECRESAHPGAFALAKLVKMAQRSRSIQCHESGEMVDAAALLRDVLPSALSQEEHQAYPDRGERSPPRAPAVREVYLSYASGTATDLLVTRLDEALTEAGIPLRRDRKDLAYRDSVSQFMQRMAAGHCVVLLVSEKYLQSEYCMAELLALLKAEDMRDRIFPIVLEDARLYDPAACARCAGYWERRAQDLDAALKEMRGDNLARLQSKLTEYTEFRRLFDSVADTLRDMNALTPGEHADTGFEQLLSQLRARLDAVVAPV